MYYATQSSSVSLQAVFNVFLKTTGAYDLTAGKENLQYNRQQQLLTVANTLVSTTGDRKN